jgi:cobaltochelatase CobS
MKKGESMSKSFYSAAQRVELLRCLVAENGPKVTKEQIISYTTKNNLPNPHFLVSNRAIKEGKIYNLNMLLNGEVQEQETAIVKEQELAPALAPVVQLRQKKLITEVDNLVPDTNKDYVPFGFYKQMEKIIKSNYFYPVFITGLSGNGKTTMVEQVCAKLKRECIRVNISIETDEDDLIGGSTLVDGNITYREGPVITAMRRGAILLIDEIDRGSNKLMCMQSILEGKPLFNKKNGDVIYPKQGFNIIATANTKGKGTEDGRFIAAQILDDAFLERFPITVEQEYPSAAIEKKIIMNFMKSNDSVNEEYADRLIAWAGIIRKTFEEGGADDLISTRRLLHIAQAYKIFGRELDAIQYCINRFDTDTKNAFLDLYTKMNSKEEPEVEIAIEEEGAKGAQVVDDIPF